MGGLENGYEWAFNELEGHHQVQIKNDPENHDLYESRKYHKDVDNDEDGDNDDVIENHTTENPLIPKSVKNIYYIKCFCTLLQT